MLNLGSPSSPKGKDTVAASSDPARHGIAIAEPHHCLWRAALARHTRPVPYITGVELGDDAASNCGRKNLVACPIAVVSRYWPCLGDWCGVKVES